MITRNFVIDIRAPVEKVFAFTTDFANLAKWQEGIEAVTQSPPGPAQLGSTLMLTRAFLGQQVEAAGVVSEFMPNQRCVFKTTSSPVQLILEQTFEPVAGGTRLKIHLQVEAGGFFKIAEPAINRQIQSTFDAGAQKLKSILES